MREIRTREKITDRFEGYKKIRPEHEMSVKEINNCVEEELRKLREQRESRLTVEQAERYWNDIFMTTTNI